MARKYIALNVDAETQFNLEAYTFWGGYDTSKGWSGNPIDKFNFHTTIVYSKNHCNSLENGTYPVSYDTWKPASVVDLDVFTFKDGTEEKIIPVMLLDQNYDSLHMHMRRLYTYFGCFCTYPDFKPHISLSYSHAAPHGIESLRNLMKREFRKPGHGISFPIKFESITVEDIIE